MTQFANFDAPTLEQRVQVRWEMDVVTDEYPDASYLEQEGFEERLQQYRRGDFDFVGVRAKAIILVPIGSGAFVRHVLQSAGLWGIESDSGEAYFAEVYAEEKAALMEQIAAIADAV